MIVRNKSRGCFFIATALFFIDMSLVAYRKVTYGLLLKIVI